MPRPEYKQKNLVSILLHPLSCAFILLRTTKSAKMVPNAPKPFCIKKQRPNMTVLYNTVLTKIINLMSCMHAGLFVFDNVGNSFQSTLLLYYIATFLSKSMKKEPKKTKFLGWRICMKGFCSR